jgi:hypothetical protein
VQPIKIMLLGGGVVPQVNIFDTLASHSATPGTATYSLNSSGIGSRSIAGGGSSTWTWLLMGLNTDYQVRVTYQSGDTPTGDALGSWLSLGTTRSWSLSVGGTGGSKDGFLQIDIRRVSDFVIIDTALVEISVG